MNPFHLFSDWFAEANSKPLVIEPSAMSLATAAADGKPSNRMVLLKGYDERGFVFYTHMESRKSEEIKQNPRAALLFFWDFGTREKPDQRQVRIEGVLEKVSNAEADAYFATRPLASRIGAWASEQSRPLDSPDILEKRVAEYETKFGDKPPRPPNWSGWRLVPNYFEFWTQGPNRLHEREVFQKANEGWRKSLLYP